MFVGALFRDSSSRVLKHYRGLVDEVERQAEELARKQIEEEEAKHEYLENSEQLEREYNMLLKLNATRRREQLSNVVSSEGIKRLVNAWATGGHIDDGSEFYDDEDDEEDEYDDSDDSDDINIDREDIPMEEETVEKGSNRFRSLFDSRLTQTDMNKLSRADRAALKHKQKMERRIAKRKAKALKEAAKVVVDYRPVMSTIIDDYLFRCPTWQYAQLLSEGREKRGKYKDNVFMFRFSQPTHIPGYKECWGKVSFIFHV